jgi:hypothetical protein
MVILDPELKDRRIEPPDCTAPATSAPPTLSAAFGQVSSAALQRGSGCLVRRPSARHTRPPPAPLPATIRTPRKFPPPPGNPFRTRKTRNNPVHAGAEHQDDQQELGDGDTCLIMLGRLADQ